MQGDHKGDRLGTSACLDAETLAAWADDGLPKAEAAGVETHLADCERCTAMLATFVRTVPEPRHAQSLWQRWRLQWLVPIATAATAAAIWVLVPSQEPVPTAILDSSPAAERQIPVAATSSSATPAQPATPGESREREIRDGVQSRVAGTLAKREESAIVNEPAAGAIDAREERAAPETFAAAPPPPAERDRADANAADSRAASRPTAAPASPAPARAAAAETTGPGATRALAQAPGVATFAAVVAQLVVASPDPMTRWRVVGAGQVERTTNGGAQWEPATLPESSTLTGGSSPGPAICWLVGRTGAIYVTTDGLRFIRVPSPDRTDLVSIQALDARRAVVVTIDGRTFRTEDQGATWIRIAP